MEKHAREAKALGMRGKQLQVAAPQFASFDRPARPVVLSYDWKRTPTLTNDAIIDLVEAGFSEGTIIKRIESSPGDFDLSPCEAGRIAQASGHRFHHRCNEQRHGRIRDLRAPSLALPEKNSVMATGAHKAGAVLRVSLLALCLGGNVCCADSALGSQAQQAKPADSTPQQTKVAPTPTPTPTPAEQEIDPDDVISVETTEILLPVTVRDATGELVSGLTRTDFRVFEDGLDQPLSDFSLRKVPVDAVLMVDASSSVASNLDDFRVAAEGFGSHLAVDDRISLIQFDDRVLLLQDWTKSLVQLRRALRRVSPGMFTRFNDALLLAARDQTPRETRGTRSLS